MLKLWQNQDYVESEEQKEGLTWDELLDEQLKYNKKDRPTHLCPDLSAKKDEDDWSLYGNKDVRGNIRRSSLSISATFGDGLDCANVEYQLASDATSTRDLDPNVPIQNGCRAFPNEQFNAA